MNRLHATLSCGICIYEKCCRTNKVEVEAEGEVDVEEEVEVELVSAQVEETLLADFK